ncbi:MAG: PadR family transcriptional regulator [Anaerotruncus sp.]|nr:PadR family transcriptional regulator [Anaerotruncus sp.]
MGAKDLVAASARTIVLSLLLSGESYGYQIIKRVRRVSGSSLEWSNAMLYTVLHQMEREELAIRSAWKAAPENRMRKYYALTESGAAALADDKARWLGLQAVLRKLLARLEDRHGRSRHERLRTWKRPSPHGEEALRRGRPGRRGGGRTRVRPARRIRRARRRRDGSRIRLPAGPRGHRPGRGFRS